MLVECMANVDNIFVLIQNKGNPICMFESDFCLLQTPCPLKCCVVTTKILAVGGDIFIWGYLHISTPLAASPHCHGQRLTPYHL